MTFERWLWKLIETTIDAIFNRLLSDFKFARETQRQMRDVSEKQVMKGAPVG